MEDCWDGIFWEYDKGLKKDNRELLIAGGVQKERGP